MEDCESPSERRFMAQIKVGELNNEEETFTSHRGGKQMTRQPSVIVRDELLKDIGRLQTDASSPREAKLVIEETKHEIIEIQSQLDKSAKAGDEMMKSI